ncbi:MAG: hypothetical protein MRZ77_03720 [Clostridiales bacterium]|nr:hypothetical protein [Clostridiales bacterium]
MSDRDLKKLNRAELLEILVKQGRELEECKARNAQLEEELNRREISIEKAGSIAEASLLLNGVFEAAQKACEQYVENIAVLSDRQEEICRKMEAESRVKAESMLSEAQRRSREVEERTKEKCTAMIRNSKEQAKQYWDEVSSRLEDFYAQHAGLRELLSIVAEKEDE